MEAGGQEVWKVLGPGSRDPRPHGCRDFRKLSGSQGSAMEDGYRRINITCWTISNREARAGRGDERRLLCLECRAGLPTGAKSWRAAAMCRKLT